MEINKNIEGDQKKFSLSEKSKEEIINFVDFLTGLDLEKINLNKIFGGDLIGFSEKFRHETFSTLSPDSPRKEELENKFDNYSFEEYKRNYDKKKESFNRLVEEIKELNNGNNGDNILRSIRLDRVGSLRFIKDNAIENLYKLFLES